MATNNSGTSGEERQPTPRERVDHDTYYGALGDLKMSDRQVERALDKGGAPALTDRVQEARKAKEAKGE